MVTGLYLLSLRWSLPGLLTEIFVCVVCSTAYTVDISANPLQLSYVVYDGYDYPFEDDVWCHNRKVIE